MDAASVFVYSEAPNCHLPAYNMPRYIRAHLRGLTFFRKEVIFENVTRESSSSTNKI